MIPRTALALIAISSLALVAAACGSDADTSSGSAPIADDLVGTTFESTGVTGYDLVEGSTIDIGFQEGSVGARAGCNTMSGGYEINDGNLEVGPMAATMMACDEPLMAQDTWLSAFLSSGPAIALDGETLTLTGSDSTITFAAQAPTEVEGTTWVLTGTVANEAISSLPASAEGTATLTITDGTAAIASGCNTGSGSVEVTDTTMTFGPIALTAMACADELMIVEGSVVLVLDGEVTYEVNGDRLSIRKDGADGEIGLEFTAS